MRSRLPDTLLIAVNEQLCSNSNPGRSAALKRGRAEYGGGHEVAGRITIEIESDEGASHRMQPTAPDKLNPLLLNYLRRPLH